jgi:hypothetical protein
MKVGDKLEVEKQLHEKARKTIKEKDEEIKKLEKLITNLEKVPDEQFKAQISHFKSQYPLKFAELEKTIGENITMDIFVQHILSKE